MSQNNIDDAMLMAFTEGEAPPDVAQVIIQNPFLLLKARDIEKAELRLKMLLAPNPTTPLPSSITKFRDFKLYVAEKIDLLTDSLTDTLNDSNMTLAFRGGASIPSINQHASSTYSHYQINDNVISIECQVSQAINKHYNLFVTMTAEIRFKTAHLWLNDQKILSADEDLGEYQFKDLAKGQYLIAFNGDKDCLLIKDISIPFEPTA